MKLKTFYQFINENIDTKTERWLGGSYLNQDNELILYHGTIKKFEKDILRNGLNVPESSKYSAKYFMLSTSLETAKFFNSEVIFKITIPKDKIVELLWKGHKTSFNDIQFAIRENIPKKYIIKL